MKIKNMTADKRNFGVLRKAADIQFLVFHYTANDGDRAVSNGRYFQNNVVEASAHYFVDDTEIVQSVPDNFVAWSVGGKKYPSCQKTGGGKWYGVCSNNNSISIELCDVLGNGKHDFSDVTLANAIGLGRNLMKKYNIPIENVIRHFDVVGKMCPSPFVENQQAWAVFKERLCEDMVKYYNTLEEVPTWAKPMIGEMIGKGCFADPRKLAVSEDMLRTWAVMLRFGK